MMLKAIVEKLRLKACYLIEDIGDVQSIEFKELDTRGNRALLNSLREINQSISELIDDLDNELKEEK